LARSVWLGGGAKGCKRTCPSRKRSKRLEPKVGHAPHETNHSYDTQHDNAVGVALSRTSNADTRKQCARWRQERFYKNRARPAFLLSLQTSEPACFAPRPNADVNASQPSLTLLPLWIPQRLCSLQCISPPVDVASLVEHRTNPLKSMDSDRASRLAV
jgi:hypothetical protein